MIDEKKAKIAIVLGSNIHWAPYYYRYEKKLIKEDVTFDLIIWNRENIKEDTKANNIFEYKISDKSDNKNPFKLIKFITFSNFVKKMILRNKYKKIIFLGTHGCAPILLANFLKKKFHNGYWLDIRDYQYEWFKPFYYLEKKSVENAYATSVSSKGYESFLPKHKYYYMHNIDSNMESFIQEYKKEEDPLKRIRISFIGNVRYYEENIKLIKIFSNDMRFLLQYFGAGSEKIKEYCDKNDIKNIRTYGKFTTKDTINFYNETDIINNVYGNSLIGLTTALSNKLYYAVCFKIPILVCKNTYMEKLSTKYNFGYVFEDSLDFPDKLYKNHIKYVQGKVNCKYDELWEKIKKDENDVNEKFVAFLQK